MFFFLKPDFKGSEIGFLSKNCLDWVCFGWAWGSGGEVGAGLKRSGGQENCAAAAAVALLNCSTMRGRTGPSELLLLLSLH